MRLRNAIGIVALLAGARCAQAASLADAQAAYAKGDFSAALQNIASAMQATTTSDHELRYDLYMLRGESLLRLKSRIGAQDAFHAAERTTDDVKKSCIASAISLLIDESAGFTYTSPRGGQPIDIRDPASRSAALEAMFEDRFEEIKPRAYKATTADNVSGILTLLPDLSDVYSLELAATGKDDRVKPLLTELGQHTRDLVAAELPKQSDRVENFAATAGEAMIYTDPNGFTSVTPRGLNTKQKQDLAEEIQYLDKIRTLCQRGRLIATRVGGAVDKWAALVSDCGDLIDRAQDIVSR